MVIASEPYIFRTHDYDDKPNIFNTHVENNLKSRRAIIINKGGNNMAAKKPAFGGYAINFKGRTETAEDIFGSKPIAPSEMTKKLWAYVKSKKLSNKG